MLTSTERKAKNANGNIVSLPHQPSPSPSVFSSVALIHHAPPPPWGEKAFHNARVLVEIRRGILTSQDNWLRLRLCLIRTRGEEVYLNRAAPDWADPTEIDLRRRGETKRCFSLNTQERNQWTPRGCALGKVNSTGKPWMAAPPTSFSCHYPCLIT